jgi:hypothetical protein
MPILNVNLSDPADVQAAIEVLMRYQASFAQVTQSAQNSTFAESQPALAQAMAEMKLKKIWPFLVRVADLNVAEYSLPELGGHIGMSSNKVCSLKAILAKPEQRLGIRFFELSPTGNADVVGNPRYRMPDAIKQAIQAAATDATPDLARM